MTRTRAIVAVLLVLAVRATSAVAQDGGRLHLMKLASVSCVDRAGGWYVARVVGVDAHGTAYLRVTRTIHGPKRTRIVLKDRLTPRGWRSLRGPRHDGRVLVRVRASRDSRPGCPSRFWEGSYPAWARQAFPLAGPYVLRHAKLPPAYAHDDAFTVRVAYLRAYFAGRKDPSGNRLAADLRSGSIPVELAAVDVIGFSVASKSEVWDTLGPPLTKLAARLPPMMDRGRWHDLVAVLATTLIRSVATHGGRRAVPLPWWKPAERALLTSLGWFPGNYGAAAEALRTLGFRLDPERPDLKKVNAVRRKLGMNPLPAGTRLGYPTYHDYAPLRLPRGSVMPTVRYLNRKNLSPAGQAKIEGQIRDTGWKLVKRNGTWIIVPLVGPSTGRDTPIPP